MLNLQQEKNPNRVENARMAYDVFVSHSSQDREDADNFVKELELRGISCWIAPRDIPYGSDFPDAIVEGLDSCLGFIVLVSRNSMNADFVKSEINLARTKRKRIFPVKLVDIEISGGLSLFTSLSQSIALFDNTENQIDSLVTTIESLRNNENDGNASYNGSSFEESTDTSQLEKENNTRKYLVVFGLFASLVSVILIAMNSYTIGTIPFFSYNEDGDNYESNDEARSKNRKPLNSIGDSGKNSFSISDSSPSVVASDKAEEKNRNYIFESIVNNVDDAISVEGWGEVAKISLDLCSADKVCTARTLEFSPTNYYLAVGTNDGWLSAWSIEKGVELFTKLAHTSRIEDVQLSNDNLIVVSASQDKSVKTWNIESGLELDTLYGSKDESIWTVPTTVDISSDDTTIITGSRDGGLRQYDAKSGETLGNPFFWDRHSVSSVDFHPNDQRILVSSLQGQRARIVDPSNGATEMFDESHGNGLSGGFYLGDGSKYFIYDNAGNGSVHAAVSGEVLFKINGHSGSIIDADADLSGETIATIVESRGDSVGPIRIWDGNTGRELIRINICDPTAVSVSHDGSYIAVGCSDNTIRIIALSEPTKSPAGENWIENNRLSYDCLPDWAKRYKRCRISQSLLSRDEKYLMFIHDDGVATLWDTASGNLLKQISRPTTGRRAGRGTLKYADISSDSRWIVTAGAPGREDELALWNLETRNLIATMLPELPGVYNVNGVSFTPDSKYVVAHSTNGVIHVFETETQKPVQEWYIDQDGLRDIELFPDNETIATAGGNGTIRIWSLKSGALILEIDASISSENRINDLDIDQTGEKMIVTRENGVVEIRRTSDGKKLVSYELHNGQAHEGKLTSEDDIAVTRGTRVKIWSTKTGQELADIDAQKFISLSSNGNRVLSSSYSNNDAVDIYSTSSGEKIGSLYGHEEDVTAAGFFNDSERIWSVARSGDGILWSKETQ